MCDERKPVFEALSSNDLLKKCAHGDTENTNESFHHLIWEQCPRTFVARRRLELAVADATIAYNDGELGRLPFLHPWLECWKTFDEWTQVNRCKTTAVCLYTWGKISPQSKTCSGIKKTKKIIQTMEVNSFKQCGTLFDSRDNGS